MSSKTIVAPKHASVGSVTFYGVLHSEWIKFRSLRSTQMLLLFTFVAVVGVGALAAWLRATIIESIMQGGAPDRGPGSGQGPGPGSGAGDVQLTLQQAIDVAQAQGISVYGIPIAGLQLGILVLGALAVLLISSEFGTGMIRSTLTAVPKRLPAFFAKAIVLVVVAYVITLISAFATFLISIPILRSYGIDMSLAMDGVLYSILMGGVYVAGVALAGLSLGTLIRSSAGGIIVLVALFFLLEIATQLLGLVPGDFWKYVAQYTPSVAGGRMLEIGDKEAFISPFSGGMIFLGWIVALTIPAIISFKSRDV